MVATMSATKDFLERRAVEISLGGRYSLASRYDTRGNRREFACRTSRVSPFQMLVEVPVLGPVGERVLAYFGDFGTLDGRITDTAGSGFLLDLELSRAKREKFSSQLTWIAKRQKETVADARQQKRLVPKSPHSTLIFGDGTTMNCLVIDISPSGVAVSADAEPEIGTRLAVGRNVGQVVRTFAEGFAVQFDRLQNFDDLEGTLIPPKDIGAYVQSRQLNVQVMVAAASDDPWFVD
jgi:hypothetical protein